MVALASEADLQRAENENGNRTQTLDVFEDAAQRSDEHRAPAALSSLSKLSKVQCTNGTKYCRMLHSARDLLRQTGRNVNITGAGNYRKWNDLFPNLRTTPLTIAVLRLVAIFFFPIFGNVVLHARSMCVLCAVQRISEVCPIEIALCGLRWRGTIFL